MVEVLAVSLGIDHHFPLHRGILRVLVVILRRQSHIGVVRNLLFASGATIDDGEGRLLAWGINFVECFCASIRYCDYGRVLVNGHDIDFSWSCKAKASFACA